MNLGLELALVLNEPWLQKSSPSIRKPLIYLGLEIDPERPIHIQVLPGPQHTLSLLWSRCPASRCLMGGGGVVTF